MKFFAFCLCLLALFSCSKETEDADMQAPVVLLTAPANNQAYAAGQTVTITGTITDNRNIREAHLEIINTITGAFLVHDHMPASGTSYPFSKTFVAQAGATYKIKVEAEDDHQNKAKAEVSVRTN